MATKCRIEIASAQSAIDAQGRKLRRLAKQLLGADVEAVHDARVASRRLRAVLSEHKRLFDKQALEAAREHARRVTSELGVARELDVSLAELDKLAAVCNGATKKAVRHAMRALAKRRAVESEKLVGVAELIKSADFKRSLRALQPRAGEKRCCYFKTASRRALKRFDAVVAASEKWKSTPSLENLHAVRISFKKLRYTCETYRDLYGPPMDVFVDCLKDAQDALGNWHDYSILKRYLGESRTAAKGETAKAYTPLRARVAREERSLLDMFRRHAEVFFYPRQVEQFRRFLSGKTDDLQREEGVCQCEHA